MSEQTDRLREIQDEIEELTREALDLVRDGGGFVEQARSYWYAHIITAVRNESEFLGKSMVTMDDTIEGMENAGDDEYGDEEE